MGSVAYVKTKTYVSHRSPNFWPLAADWDWFQWLVVVNRIYCIICVWNLFLKFSIMLTLQNRPDLKTQFHHLMIFCDKNMILLNYVLLDVDTSTNFAASNGLQPQDGCRTTRCWAFMSSFWWKRCTAERTGRRSRSSLPLDSTTLRGVTTWPVPFFGVTSEVGSRQLPSDIWICKSGYVLWSFGTTNDRVDWLFQVVPNYLLAWRTDVLSVVPDAFWTLKFAMFGTGNCNT